MPFKPGQSGNPAGRPISKEKYLLRDMCRGYVARSFDLLKEIAENTAAKESARVTAIKLMWEYGFGKPLQPVSIEEVPHGAVNFMSSTEILEQIQVLEQGASNQVVQKKPKNGKKGEKN